MAAKSKSITNPIPWSSLLKPLLVAVAWLVLPWWAFLAVALYCYLVPFFRPLSLAPAFLIFLFIALSAPVGFFQAIYAGVVLALIFGIKDFLIVNRRSAYQLLVFLISFAGSLLLFGTFMTWSVPASFSSLALSCLLWLWLVRSDPERQDVSMLHPAIAALLLFEIGTVMFFLPVNFFAQAALFLFSSALLFEAATNMKALTLKQASVWAGGYAAISLLVVLLESWKV
jgi:hypothetical protein